MVLVFFETCLCTRIYCTSQEVDSISHFVFYSCSFRNIRVLTSEQMPVLVFCANYYIHWPLAAVDTVYICQTLDICLSK